MHFDFELACGLTEPSGGQFANTFNVGSLRLWFRRLVYDLRFSPAHAFL